jgi:HD-GYP domain-containing protein (c-di-GMP phosphodiesterase class II)
MTSDRSYRAAMSQREALRELRLCAGSQFDPVITRVFLDVLAQTAPLNAPPAPTAGQ